MARAVRFAAAAVLFAVVLPLSACSKDSPLPVPLTAAGQIRLPSETARPEIDLLTFDLRNGHLYVPHTSQNALDVIDTKAGKVLASIQGLAGIKGVALTPDPAVVFTSNGGEGTVGVVEVSQMKVLSKIRVGGKPDAIEYDQIHDVVAVSVGGPKGLALVDRATYKIRATVELPGHPELMAMDRKAGRLFLAIHDKDEVVAIDLGSGEVRLEYKGCDIKSPTGVAYDPEQERLFVASKGQLNIIDLLLDRCLGSVDIGSGTDQIAINPHTRHLYAANGGSKNLSVIDIVTLKPLGIVGTGPDAGSLAVDSTTDRVYVGMAQSGFIAIYHDP